MSGPSCKRIEYELIRGTEAVIALARVDGNEVGRVSAGLGFGQQPFSVGFSAVDRSMQRCGIATKLYEMVAQGACDLGYKLSSDTYRSKSSQGFWTKQVKKGRARCVSTADAALVEQQAKDFPRDEDTRYGRGDCDRYELVGCPVGSLAGRRRGRRR